MRIKVALLAETLPIVYKHRFTSLIKQSLYNSDENYKDNFYGSKKTRPFTFNVAMPVDNIKKKRIIQLDKTHTIEDTVYHFPDKELSLYISTNDYEFLMHLYNGLRKMKVFHFSSDDTMLVDGKKIDLEIKKVLLLNERKIQEKQVIFKTNSPILIENNNDKPVIFEDEEFNAEFNRIHEVIFKAIRGNGLSSPIEFTPVKMKKQVIKHTLKEFREKTGKPVMYLTGTTGIFSLKGTPEDLDLLYKIGVGNRTGQGFGMVEILG